MSNPVEQDIALSIYKGLFDALTGSDGAGKPAFDPRSTYLTMETVGRAVRSLDFANPWSPGNPTGSKDAAKNVADLVDHIPATNPTVTDTGHEVSKVYGEVANLSNVKPPTPDPALEAAYKKAGTVLYREVEVTDPETGEKIQKTVETETYRSYKKNLAAWRQAQAGYMGSFLAANATPEGRNTWPMLGPTLSAPVKIAYDDWQAQGASEIEDALATRSMSSQNQIGQVFSDAKRIYQSYGVDLDGNAALLTMRSMIYPTDWCSSDAADWPQLTISQGTTNSSRTAEENSYGGGASVSVGLWSFGGGVDHTDSHEHLHADTKDINISFRFMLCTISRPWMDAGLLALPNWSMGALYPPGKISNAEREQTGTAMPLLPMSFIAVRDVRIKADWGSSDEDHAKSTTSGSASVGWGPFAVSGHYSHSSSTDTFHAEWDNGTLVLPQLQIIGWINKIVEFCPPA